jgi:hypothetical protein
MLSTGKAEIDPLGGSGAGVALTPGEPAPAASRHGVVAMDLPEGAALAYVAARPTLEVTKAAIAGVEVFLSKVCKPAATEFGQFLKDKVHCWRSANMVATMKNSESKMATAAVPEGHHAHPRIVHQIVEESSWTDDATVQDLWAGLLVSSCTEDGEDDSNLIFVNLLGELTKMQARIVKYTCETARRHISPNGLVMADGVRLTSDELKEIARENDIHRLDRELDHLRSLDLIDGGFHPQVPGLVLRPTVLCLTMYVRCQGSRLSVINYFDIKPEEQPVPPSATQP